MQILNGKNSTLTFRLDNGEIMRVKPGELSKAFVPSIFQLQSIIAMGNPKEIAILLSSSYEMDVLKQLNGTLAYLQPNEKVAREIIINGKSFTPEAVTHNDIKIEQLKSALSDKYKEVSELTEELKKVKDQLENSPIEEYKSQLLASNEQLEKANSNINELSEKLHSTSVDFGLVNKELESVKAEKSALEVKVNELSAKVSELEVNSAKLAEDKSNFEKANEDLKEFEAKFNELNSKYEELQKENNSLKEDGIKLVENYKKAKDALLGVMDKFHIKYENGDYIQLSE